VAGEIERQHTMGCRAPLEQAGPEGMVEPDRVQKHERLASAPFRVT
jgi:hypothetical protein